MFENKAGVTKVAPVKTGVPPVAVVYQLNVTPAVLDVAASVAVWPDVICAFAGVVVTTGFAGTGLTITSSSARVVLIQVPFAAST